VAGEDPEANAAARDAVAKRVDLFVEEGNGRALGPGLRALRNGR
jgi:hypothetical protein